MGNAKAIHSLVPLLRLYPWGIPVIVGLGILASLSEGFGISLFIPLLQSLDQSSTTAGDRNVYINFINQFSDFFPADNRLIVLAAAIFACILLKNCLAYGNTVLFAWLNSRISHRLRSGIFNQLLNVSYSFLERSESGKLLNTLATETWKTSQALSVLVNLIINICTIFVFGILLILISWQMTLLVTVLMLGISLGIQIMTRQVKQLGQQAVATNSELANRMWEGFGGMKVIRSFGQEAYEQRRFDHASINVRNTFLKLDMVSGLVSPVSEILSAILLLCSLLFALQHDRAALPALLTFIFILYRLQPKVKQLNSARVGLVAMASSVQDVLSLLDHENKPYLRSGSTFFSGLQRGIALRSVMFHYDPLDQPALQDISIYIPKGKTTAFVGPSGAGKSTLINLICRFYDPTEGEIQVDDRPLHTLDLTSWRSRIAIVSQDVYMFSTSVRDNIAYGRLEATDSEIEEAAKLANAHDFICELPNGYDTKVGDRGLRLSGGQRQRIALARAIIRDPDILVLDEATNALDSISENLIQEALNTLSQNRTVIVIAHRLSTIEQADQIIVLQAGRVVEQGNLNQLLSLDGLFAQLYQLQNRSPQSEILS
ncbi:MAG: ABC transporter ATP-binding protein [Elainellaceae cyanobacterium]